MKAKDLKEQILELQEPIYQNPKSIEEKELIYQLESLSAQIAMIDLNSDRILNCVGRINGLSNEEITGFKQTNKVYPTGLDLVSLLKFHVVWSFEQSQKIRGIADTLEKLV
jgi:hypothetical protein